MTHQLRWFRLILLALLLTIFLSFSPVARAAGSGNWRTYTTNDGLLSNNVQALAYSEDPLTFPPCVTDCPTIPGLWVGTDRGLTYLNGRNDVLFLDNLPSLDVRDLLFDGDGRLWIATARGLTWLDYNGTPEDNSDDEWGGVFLRERGEILSLAQTGAGSIWAGTATGLAQVDLATNETTIYWPNDRITALPSCPLNLNGCDVSLDGQLWVGTEAGLRHRDLADNGGAGAVADHAVASAHVTALTRTAAGIWVGTAENGAAHWNGREWDTHFDGIGDLATPNVRDIDLDENGRVWFATDAGVSRWNPTRNTWRRYFTFRDPIASDDVQTLLIDSSGVAWLGADQGVSGVDGSWEMLTPATTYDGGEYLASNTVKSVAFDPETGYTWVGTAGGGITVFNREVEVVQTLTSNNSGLVDDDVRAVTVDTETGWVWVGTSGGGVTVFDREMTIVQTLTSANSGLASDLVQALVFDPETGRIWVGMLDGGVTVFDQEMETVQTLTSANSGLTDDDVQALTLDPILGFVWVGSQESVTAFDSDFQHMTTIGDLRAVTTLAVDPDLGTIWVGTQSGLRVFTRRLDAITLADDVPGSPVQAVALDPTSRQAWVGTSSGLVILDRQFQVVKVLSAENDGLATDLVRAVAINPETGQTWVGTQNGGVTLFDREYQDVRALTAGDDALTGADVAAVVWSPATGRTWVGTNGFGVIVFDRELQVVDTLTAENGDLPSNTVRVITLDDNTGRAWVGTNNGVAVFDQDLQLAQTFTAENSDLDNDFIRTVAVDTTTGNTWVATMNGIAIFDPELQFAQMVTAENSGLEDEDVTVLTLDPETGRAWIGTRSATGLTVLGPDLQVEQRLTNEDLSLPSDRVQAISLSGSGVAWVGTDRGLATIGQDLQMLFTFTEDSGLLNGNITEIVHAANGRSVWIGTAGGGFLSDPLFPTEYSFTVESGALADDYVRALALDAETGRVWVGTSAGVSLFEPHGRQPWVRFSQATEHALAEGRLLDTRQLNLTFEGGSLIVPPQNLAYDLSLEDIGGFRFAPGDVGATSPGLAPLGDEAPLAYQQHRVTLTVFGADLKTYALPPLEFDVQASPAMTLTQIAGFTLDAITEETIFPAQDGLTINWTVDDPDAEPGESVTLEYAWNYTGDPETTAWRQVEDNQIPPPDLERGEPEQTFTLALAVRLVDGDGNPSSPSQPPNLTFSAPPSVFRLLLPYLETVGFASLLFAAGVTWLSRSSGLPAGMLLRRRRHLLFVGLGYRRYRSLWQNRTPLERLLILLIPGDGVAQATALREQLTENQTPAEETRLSEALEALAGAQLLDRAEGGYRLTEPALATALQEHEGEDGCATLYRRVRAEHPLLAEAQRFFTEAGFECRVHPAAMAFACAPALPAWKKQFGQPIYTHVLPGEPLDRQAVVRIYEAAQADAASGREVIFVVVDQTPQDSAWLQIGALRADNAQIIPIDDALIQRGREQEQANRVLQAHLRRFLGRRRDLYNVRDPVADRLNFFGREARANELLEMLGEGRPLALFGLRKMGKSSLLHYLRDKAPFPVAYVDLQAGVDLAGLYGRILESWQRSLRVKADGCAWEPPSLPSDQATGASWLSNAFTAAARDLMAQLEAGGRQPRLGLFVDEIEIIVPHKLKEGGDPEPETLARYLEVARTLRGLSQESGNLSLLVVGVDPSLNRVNRWAGQQNPFYQFFREEYLAPLSRPDCIQMVRNIGRQMGLAYGDSAVDFVADASGGHPFLARQLCSAALRALGDTTTGGVVLGLLEEAADRFVREPSTAALLDEHGLWGEITDTRLWPRPQIRENQTLLISLAERELQLESELLATGHYRPARERALFELTQRFVLGKRNAKLRIQFGLFRRWIKRYKLGER